MFDFYTNAEPWDHGKTPPTSKVAKPIKWQPFDNVRAIEVKGARYRSSVFDGVFLLDREEAAFPSSGDYVVKVYSLWFGRRLPTGVPIKLKVDGSRLTYHANYSGEAVIDIASSGRRRSPKSAPPPDASSHR